MGAHDAHQVDQHSALIDRDIRFFAFILWQFLHFSISLTYIVRLHITFKSSVYQMSTRLIVVFICIMIFYHVTMVSGSILFIFTEFTLVGFLLCVVCGFFSYLIGCVLAVYFFISNLSKLTKDLLTSPRTAIANIVKDVTLDQQQLKLSKLSSKYTMLFAFSITSTVIFVTVLLSVPHQLRGPFIALDCCVNLWCMYLQFGFAENHYLRCCGWCDKRCRHCGMRRTKKIIYKHSAEITLAKMKNAKCVNMSTNEMNIAIEQSSTGGVAGKHVE